MSPESYVLLLISCWLLLASALLWGMLRISRRHYTATPASDTETYAAQDEAAALVAQRTRQAQHRKLRTLPLQAGYVARTFGFKRRLGC